MHLLKDIQFVLLSVKSSKNKEKEKVQKSEKIRWKGEEWKTKPNRKNKKKGTTGTEREK